MKKNNKGFSLVELIIVIAIMAILAGALAPALIKYIAKSRQSTDVQNADTLRTSVQTSLANPDAADASSVKTSGIKAASTFISKTGDEFQKEMASQMGNNSVKIKYQSKATGAPTSGDDMYISIDVANNTVTVYADKGGKFELSPNACEDWGGAKVAKKSE